MYHPEWSKFKWMVECVLEWVVEDLEWICRPCNDCRTGCTLPHYYCSSWPTCPPSALLLWHTGIIWPHPPKLLGMYKYHPGIKLLTTCPPSPPLPSPLACPNSQTAWLFTTLRSIAPSSLQQCSCGLIAAWMGLMVVTIAIWGMVGYAETW